MEERLIKDALLPIDQGQTKKIFRFYVVIHWGQYIF